MYDIVKCVNCDETPLIVKRMQNSEIAMKLKSKKIKFGTVVFLKNQTEIRDNYDNRLLKLVNARHRFVVGPNFGKRCQCVPVYLLSTSEFSNVVNRKGRLLTGNYGKFGNGKDVYVDLEKVWLIKKDNIKEIAYNLSKSDICLLIQTILDSTLAKNNLKAGVKTESSIFKNEFNDYAYMYNFTQNDSNMNELNDILFIATNARDRIPEEKYEDFVNSYLSKFGTSNDIMNEYKKLIDSELPKLNGRSEFIRYMYRAIWSTILKDEALVKQIAYALKRGYTYEGEKIW